LNENLHFARGSYDYSMASDALTIDEAYQGTTKSRIGFFNDCFLANSTDAGTYGYSDADVAIAKPYVTTESKYTPMGGETCGYDQEYGECANTLTEMRNLHWSYLNKYYHPDNFAAWAAGGCLETIKKSLGYRLQLVSGSYPGKVAAGTLLNYSIQLNNNGFAAPFNARKVELVLKESSTGEIHTVPLPNTDPRYWFAGEVHIIDEAISIPHSVPSGAYHLYLNLPDPEPALTNNPLYSIRLANQGTWESVTGYNDLRHTVIVVNQTPSNIVHRTDL
jgi:hypothetical protein